MRFLVSSVMLQEVNAHALSHLHLIRVSHQERGTRRTEHSCLAQCCEVGSNKLATRARGDTLVFYHPHAKRAPQVVPTRELVAIPRGSSGNSEDLLPLDSDSQPHFFPFKSLADFEQTELFIKHDHTDGEINIQLDLWRRNALGAGVTLKNAREMHQCLQTTGIEEDLSQVISSSTMFPCRPVDCPV